MQVRAVTLGAMFPEEVRHQQGSVAPSPVGRKRAKPAELPVDLTMFPDVHPLTAHRNQLPAIANAEVRTEFAGAWSKEAWERRIGKSNHLGGVRAMEWFNCWFCCVRNRRVGGPLELLNTLRAQHLKVWMRSKRLVGDQVSGLPRFEQVVELSDSLRRVFRNSCERNNVAGKFERTAIALHKPGLNSFEGLKRRVRKKKMTGIHERWMCLRPRRILFFVYIVSSAVTTRY